MCCFDTVWQALQDYTGTCNKCWQVGNVDWWVTWVQGPQASVLAQMFYLVQRVLRQWRRHPIMLIGEAVQYIFIGAYVGALCSSFCLQIKPVSIDLGPKEQMLHV